VNKKGQGMAIDMMAAVLIFLVIGGSIMFVWTDKEIEAEERLFENERIAMTERTLDTMIKSNGLPKTGKTEMPQTFKCLDWQKETEFLMLQKLKNLQN